MSVIEFGIVVGVAVAAYAAYQLYKAKKAVTVASVEAQAKADVAVAKTDAKKL
jgi:uncharacterized membrane protein YebE (DUF533 family)